MKFDLPTVQALVRKYQALQGLTAWSFAVEIVPGLQHNGEDAWATVETDPAAKSAIVRVRDLVSTPVKGFAGDPWTELCVTVSHELWHPWVTFLLANPSEENEEALVEAAAQAVVRSAGTDARVMARSIKGLPNAIRARVAKVSARAATRARGGAMDGKAVLAAIKDKDEAGALTILESWAAEQIAAAQGASTPAPAEPAPGEPPADMRAAPPMPAKPGAKPGEGDAEPDSEDARALAAARKARTIKMSEDEKTLRARQVAATTEIEAARTSVVKDAIETKIMRAREVDKVTLLPEDERDLRACGDVASAEKMLGIMRRHAGEAVKRARAIGPDGKPVEPATVVPGDAALLEGLSAMDLDTYHSMKSRSVEAANTYAREAQKIRARVVASQKGGAS